MKCNIKSTISGIGWIFIVIMFATGTSGSLLYKGMFTIKAAPHENSAPIQFDHAYMITMFMYMGQFLDILIVIVTNMIKKYRQIPDKPYDSSKEPFSLTIAFSFFAPTIIDVIGSTLYNLSCKYALISICQMVRNTQVIFVAAFSALSFKKYRQKFDLPHLVGLVMVVIGMAVICITSIFYDKNSEAATNNALGIVLVLLSSVFFGVVFVMEEYMFGKVEMSGMHGVTSEGMWGSVIYMMLIFTFGNSFQNGKLVEDLQAFSYQMIHTPALLVLLIFYVLTIIFYSWSSLQITYHVNSVARSMFDSAKTILIWIISLAIGWEKADPVGTPLKLLGYLVVAIGVLIYNQVVKWIPYLKVVNKTDYQKIENQEGPENELELSEKSTTSQSISNRKTNEGWSRLISPDVKSPDVEGWK